jgi:hypothetical protein
VFGSERWAKLVLFLILARVAAQGSRLSAVRWAPQHAVAETLGLKPFDEDDLYEALDRLAEEQEDIEEALYRRIVRQQGGSPTVVLYDVTSSYLEGEQNELAAFGYNRDKKPGKAQIVIGLLTTVDGEPLEQLPENLSRKGFVPIIGSTHSVMEDLYIFVVVYCWRPLYADPQTALSR